MNSATPYPRVAHLVAGRGSRNDTVLSAGESRTLLSGPVVVEEKLDGANVVLWADGGRVQCATRGGAGAIDRAGQLGPLRAWAAEHADALRQVVDGSAALYGEWLLLTHTVAYDRLPSYLVVLDLLLADGTWAGVDDRNHRCSAAGLETPPELHRGMLADVDAAEGLLGPSRVGDVMAEGVVVRALGGQAPRLAKLVRSGFRPLSDDDWAASPRPRNQLADWAASWH